MKPRKQVPKPDVKSATRQALTNIADSAERLDWMNLFSLPPARRTTAEETAAFAEAKRLAINYIRLGAKG